MQLVPHLFLVHIQVQQFLEAEEFHATQYHWCQQLLKQLALAKDEANTSSEQHDHQVLIIGH